MEERHKILLLDDDTELLAVYRDVLAQLPSKPEIHTATNGTRAISLLDAEPFRLLICDLKMPKMDGLQVLSIVRRRFPELRTVVLTAVPDEEFRARAYALGVDLFWLKPETQQNMKMFLECIESLLGRDVNIGFRGIQSKSLIDIIQMECLSQSSTILRLTRGSLVAKIWIQDGELIDAEAEGARGEAAFRRILEWKAGTFENLPAEPGRERTIKKPVNALLLESVQAIDEGSSVTEPDSLEQADHRKTIWKLSALTREGADFVVTLNADGTAEGWGTQAGEKLTGWIRTATETAKRLGDRVGAGPLSHVQGHGMERRVLLLPRDDKIFLVAWPPDVAADQLLDRSKQLVATWNS
jgi:CheY-like chemotaxis protein